MKQIKKMLCVSLAICLCIAEMSAFAVNIPYGSKIKNKKLQTEIKNDYVLNGSVTLEAESLQINTKAAKVEDDADASDGKTVHVTAGMETDPTKISEPTVSQEFKVSAHGIYFIWMRVKTPDSGSDSIFYSTDGESYTPVYFKAQENYYWYQIGVALIESDVFKLAFKYREANMLLDKLIVANNPSFKPEEKTAEISSESSFETMSLYEEPPIKPISGHPRLYLTKDYIPTLREKVKAPELAAAYQKMQLYAQDNINATLENKVNNYSAGTEYKIMARALMYVMGEVSDEHAKQTVEYAKEYLKTVKYNTGAQDITRAIGVAMVMGAVVYDWCYDCLEEADKDFFITRFKYLASQKEIGYPPTKQSGITTHASEAEIMRDLLSAGIAMYDEDPEMYNLSAGRFFQEYIESRKMFYKAGLHPEGSAYGPYRYQWEMVATEIFSRMGYDNVFGQSSENVALQWVYSRRPDGLLIKDGDEFTYSSNTYFKYPYSAPQACMTAGSYYKNPYIKGDWIKSYALSEYYDINEDFWNILFSDPSVEAKSPESLPLARKTGYPLSSVTARTNWQNGIDSPTAIANMRAYEAGMGNHGHYDAGAFQIYYKGNLAIDSGNYHGKTGSWGSSHYWNYSIRSVAHNVMTVYDPDEVFSVDGTVYSNDGGQRVRDTVMNFEELKEKGLGYAKNEGTYIGPNEKTPEFSYIKTDLTGAYSSKVKNYKRAMVFMDLFDDDYPAALVVFDKMQTSKAGYKQSWLLHSIEEPKTEGDFITIARTEYGYNGKLVNKMLLPERNKRRVEIIGGEGAECLVDGVNYPNPDNDGSQSEQGQWRVEISPSGNKQDNLLLNAMYVTDYDKNLPVLEMKKTESNHYVGVVVKDRQVMFAKDGEISKKAINLKVEDNGAETVGCLITDLAEGVWIVKGNDTNLTLRVNPGENALYFRGKPGQYAIKLANEETEVQKINYPETPKQKVGDFEIYRNGRFLYNNKETKLIDGVPYVPMESLFKQIGAKVQILEDGKSAEISFNDNTARIHTEKTSYELNGAAVELPNAPRVYDGVIYVAADDFKKVFNMSFDYDSISKIMFIKDIQIDKEYYRQNAIAPVASTASDSDATLPIFTSDLNLNTRWSKTGDGEWLMYDLGKVYDISAIHLSFYNGHTRKALFDIEVSSDGRNFTKVLSTESCGTTSLMEEFPVKCRARYVRYVGHGTNVKGVTWNSINEMQIIGQEV